MHRLSPRHTLPLLLVALGACYGPGAFQADLLAAECDKLLECGWLDAVGWSHGECLAQDVPGFSPGYQAEDLDPAAARACLQAIRQASCDDWIQAQGLEACEAP